jgi:hypothetical protein
LLKRGGSVRICTFACQSITCHSPIADRHSSVSHIFMRAPLYSSLSSLLCLRILALFDTLWTLLTLHKSHLYLCYRADDIKDPATEPRTEELTRLLISRTERTKTRKIRTTNSRPLIHRTHSDTSADQEDENRTRSRTQCLRTQTRTKNDPPPQGLC